MTGRRLAVLVAVALVAAAIVASSAQAALFFLFKPTAAGAGDFVTVRLGGTPESFTPQERERPFQQAIRVYLAPADVSGEVGSRYDRRLHFVGALVPDKRSRGVLSFRVPPLDTGPYVLAYWCPGCARFSRGVKFGVQTVPEVSRYRRWMGLRVRLADATTTCPVSGENTYGNGLLSTTLPRDGVLGAPQRADGLFAKLPWTPHTPYPEGELLVAGERLDGDGELRVHTVRWGTGNSWRTAVTFPSEGCWRITGRVRDISLSYVVRVVASS